ncbi:uncharacterized protein PITG_16002 [Phytophthora infestans T30-4]|uniref:Ubiquitin-like domain-containing protein n=1 Tax=Phytophthora infestans (strain T30-4) TaxID=403677 RepID=D0NSM3_PHYIT|nr:uncharacterized protein PITG_16002 [Phytophthora infestans T30-4]EEY64585.1 conserved hypothetical protein [Phytophthora infestans T30-4]|eukprot:XP_002897785.1 conserved hypothetical protein [Phytophthora infestans T30-4]
MAKTDPVPLTRSPAEISTLNSLRSLPDFLQYSQRPQSGDPNDRGRNVVTSSVTALRSLCNTQGRCQSVSNTAEPGSLQRWLALAEISAELDDDVQNLEREIQVHERKRSALERSNLTKLPPAESCELGTKLQCLQEVLGTARFRTYCRDLFMLVRNLRLRLDLYGFRLLAFERHLCRDRLVSVEKLLWLMNETERCLPTPEETNRPESTMAESSPPISREDFALLFQHCSGPETPEAVVVTEGFMTLLRSLPLERTTVVRYVFEQLADSRRGEGYRPPPDYTRVHHIHAAIKLQRSHCSTAEMEAAEAWLQVVGTEAVTLQDLLQFHLTVSDAHVSEDAQFVRFVQRMWGFDPLAVKDADRGDAIQRLVENYTARCNLLELITRKRELLAKIPGAQARIRSAATLLESELQHLRALQAPAGLSLWLQCDEDLRLSGNKLTSLPSALVAIPNLEILDLSRNMSNQLRMLPVEIAECTQLQTLHVNDNSLQSLPKKLVQLPYLETLNAAHNELTEIPSEWHAFETQNDGSRVLHSLMLRRNPLSNKILMSIVDGSTDSSLYSTTTGLNEDEEGLSNRSKWRGVARDVCHYLEQRLRAMQRPSTGRHSAPLRADVKSFERLIRALPFTCSKRELTHLVRRFIVLDDAEDEEPTKRTRQIDGLAFLQAIERFGRWRSISTPSKRSMNSVLKPVADSAGPIIQYLVVLHRRMQQEQEVTERGRSAQQKLQFKKKLRRQKETAKTPGKKNPGVAKQKLSPSRNRASQQPMKPSKARADVLADRQRQRIQVLEQQLVDQKLLLLARQQPNVGRNRSSEDNNDSAIAPADLALVSDKDRRERQTGDGTVTIRVKCPLLREKIGNQQMHTMENNACLDCCLHVQSDESVLHLKHQLEAQTGVPVDHQILVTNSGRRGAPAIRLRNNSKLREYSEHVGGWAPGHLTFRAMSVKLQCEMA